MRHEIISRLKENWWVFAPVLLAIWLTYASYQETKNIHMPPRDFVVSA